MGQGLGGGLVLDAVVKFSMNNCLYFSVSNFHALTSPQTFFYCAYVRECI